MSQMQNNHHGASREKNEDDLERQLLEGVSLTSAAPEDSETQTQAQTKAATQPEENDEDQPTTMNSDVQGALGLFAEATQDMATAGVELGIGRHFACADYCNQVAEKAAQAVSLLHTGHRIKYDHDLRLLGSQVGAPEEILVEMERLTPFHPEAFYADTPPEEADEVINAEQASSYMRSARKVLNWAKSIVLKL